MIVGVDNFLGQILRAKLGFSSAIGLVSSGNLMNWKFDFDANCQFFCRREKPPHNQGNFLVDAINGQKVFCLSVSFDDSKQSDWLAAHSFGNFPPTHSLYNFLFIFFKIKTVTPSEFTLRENNPNPFGPFRQGVRWKFLIITQVLIINLSFF